MSNYNFFYKFNICSEQVINRRSNTTSGLLTDFIKEQFNHLGNRLNGTYYKIQAQRDNAVQYEMYSLLEEKALLDGNKVLADIYRLQRDEKCYLPTIDDPTYAGSYREAQDKFDAAYMAEESAHRLDHERKRREAGLPSLPFGLEYEF